MDNLRETFLQQEEQAVEKLTSNKNQVFIISSVKTVKTEWVSGIEISESREAETQSCFDNKVEFYPISDADGLKKLIKTFNLSTEDMIEQDDVNINETIYGEKRIMDRLIVMDDVSGIADSCKEFADFLTVSQKYR